MKEDMEMGIGRALLALTVLGFAAGCTPVEITTSYASLSTHTLQVAADKQADVVWLQQYKDGEFILMRCYNGDAPTCVRAKTP